MSYEYLPKSLQADAQQELNVPATSMVPTEDENNNSVSNDLQTRSSLVDPALSEQLKQAESLLREKVDSETRHSKEWENHMFLLAQLFYEHKEYQKSHDAFRDLVTSKSGSIFYRQANYQLAILGFDKKLHSHGEAFKQLQLLCKPEKPSQNDLFSVCANYNLGLATFNGFNPNVASGKVLPVARDFWIAAAGGTEEQLSQPINVKAIDIFQPKDKQIADDSQELLFYRALAQCKLGQLYSYESEYKDEERAFFWHTEAAGNGNVESQGVLGVMNLYGVGAQRNEKSGLYCLKQAAGANNLYAMGRLCEYYYKKKLYSHCVAYSKPYAVKFLHDTKTNILADVRSDARKCHCTEAFAVKGATLCAFYFARCMESGVYNPSKKSDDDMDDNDALLAGVKDGPLKIYKACASIEPGLMVDLQQQRLHSEI